MLLTKTNTALTPTFQKKNKPEIQQPLFVATQPKAENHSKSNEIIQIECCE